MSPFRIAAVVGFAALPTHAQERYFGVGPACKAIFEDSAGYKAQAADYAACAVGPLLNECKSGIAAKVYAGLIGPGQAHDQDFVDCLKWEPGNFGQPDWGSACKDALRPLLTVADQATYDTALSQCDLLVGDARIAKCKINTYNTYLGRLPFGSRAVIDRCLGTFSQLDNRVDFVRTDAVGCYQNLGASYALGESINSNALKPLSQVVTWFTTSRDEARLGNFEACLAAKVGGMSDTCRAFLGVSPSATDEEVARAFLGLSKADRADFLQCKALFPAHAGSFCDEIFMSNAQILEVNAKCNNDARCAMFVRKALWKSTILSKQDAFNTCKSIFVPDPAGMCVTWEVARLMPNGGQEKQNCPGDEAAAKSCFLQKLVPKYVSLNKEQRAAIRARCIVARAGK